MNPYKTPTETLQETVFTRKYHTDEFWSGMCIFKRVKDHGRDALYDALRRAIPLAVPDEPTPSQRLLLFSYHWTKGPTFGDFLTPISEQECYFVLITGEELDIRDVPISRFTRYNLFPIFSSPLLPIFLRQLFWE